MQMLIMLNKRTVHCLLGCVMDEELCSFAPVCKYTRVGLLQLFVSPPTGQPVHRQEGKQERWMVEKSQGRQGKKLVDTCKTGKHSHLEHPAVTQGNTELCIISLPAGDPGWLGGGPAERVRLSKT